MYVIKGVDDTMTEAEKFLAGSTLGNKSFVVKEVAEKREFSTGAKRNKAEGKGRCDLLPASSLLRLAVHLEKGAEIYGERNWEKGIPISEMMSSGMRHMLNYLQGEATEDHLAAAAFNILGAMFMEDNVPDMQDVATRKRPDDYRDVMGVCTYTLRPNVTGGCADPFVEEYWECSNCGLRIPALPDHSKPYPNNQCTRCMCLVQEWKS
jgi:hypothetical protein